MEEFQPLNGNSGSSPVTAKAKGETLNLKEEIGKYLFHWKWILLSVALCFILISIYLRYTTPLYSATATILVKDDRKGGLNSELAVLEDLGVGKGLKSNLDNELHIITSRTMMEETVRKLNLNISYFSLGRFHLTELYKDTPILCTVLDPDDAFANQSSSVILQGIDASSFELQNAEGKVLGKYAYGQLIPLEHCKLVVEKNSQKNYFTTSYLVKVDFSRFDNVVAKYLSRVEVTKKDNNSSVIDLRITDANRDKAESILNYLIEIYNQDAIDDKSFVSRRTEKFIDDRLKIIASELGDVEKVAESYKRSNQITDITSEASLYMQNAVLYEKNLIEVETQINVAKAMLEHMQKATIDQVVPINILSADNSAGALIVEYNQLVIERNRLLQGGGKAKNNAIKNQERRIDEVRESIIESLNSQQEVLNIRKRDLQKQNDKMIGKISQVPTQEREFRIIDRQQKIKEALYIYLLQKREEIAISLQVAAPNAKIVDEARASYSPISPNRKMFQGFAIIVGLLIPIIVIYLMHLMDTKIRRRQDIEKESDIPFLGNIPRLANPQEIVDIRDRSGAAEAFRIIRINLDFMFMGINENQAKTIMVTSTIAKEGKTSVATNLASIISMSNKRVLLMGLDIRNPQIHKYLDVPAEGFTNYITQNSRPLSDFIHKVEGRENLWVLPAGAIPPNPAELLMSEGVEALFAKVREQFDYIVVDTAPVSLVADTLLISKYADVSLYVMRAHFLEKRLVKLAQLFYQEKKIPNMAVVLNDTTLGKGYGYGSYGYGDYGYGYASESHKPLPWWKRIFKKS